MGRRVSKLVGEPDGATPLEPEEMEGLLHKHITTREQLDELEQINIQDGLRWLARQKNGDPFTEEFVRELHKRLFGQVWRWAGTFRRSEKNIGIDPLRIAIDLRNLLDDARYWAEHNTYPPKELAVRFHHRLVYIHPFPNGNGRHARILADAVLSIALGESPIDWARGIDLQKMSNHRADYIAALRAADVGNFDPLLRFVDAEG
jgi:Fic-DOC domain mobile mystery protein B